MMNRRHPGQCQDQEQWSGVHVWAVKRGTCGGVHVWTVKNGRWRGTCVGCQKRYQCLRIPVSPIYVCVLTFQCVCVTLQYSSSPPNENPDYMHTLYVYTVT